MQYTSKVTGEPKFDPIYGCRVKKSSPSRFFSPTVRMLQFLMQAIFIKPIHLSCSRRGSYNDLGDSQKRSSQSTNDSGASEMKASSSYAEWIASVQTTRNKDWAFNVTMERGEDEPTPPKFDETTLFRSQVEDYAMKVGK